MRALWLQRLRPLWKNKRFRIGFVSYILVALASSSVYLYFQRFVDERLKSGPFADSVTLFTAPKVLSVGDQVAIDELVSDLLKAGYTTEAGNPTGSFKLDGATVSIRPGRHSYFKAEPAALRFEEGRLTGISSLADGSPADEYLLEPQVLVTLASNSREKRRIVRFDEIPKCLVQAVLSAEDKNFFEHSGFDGLRLLKALYVNLRAGRKEQGGSTLTMQLARGLWLDPGKRWSRKLRELAVAFVLERRLTKEEIFTHYANQIFMGRHVSYNIHGFAEAARAYFSKDLRELSVAEAATLAGLVQRPSYYHPIRHPERARQRRDLVLSLMRRNGYLSASEEEAAAAEAVRVSPHNVDFGDAPYFVALAVDELEERVPESGLRSDRVYTTLDARLQNAALEAIRESLPGIDKRLGKNVNDKAQIALIALNPRTGAVKALIGGRSYAESQLNHAIAKRQPGSVFKPLVYAAAMQDSLRDGAAIVTPTTVVADLPTTFRFEGQTYQPGNFHDSYHGEVTIRQALAKSLNIPAVMMAQKVGFRKVAELAYSAGLNRGIQPTPAIALGAYETSPLEMAGSYTIFANDGVFVKPTFLASVRTTDGRILAGGSGQRRDVLDPRVAYLMTDMLQEVLRSGTGAGVRSRGYELPAAGKTGTSRDGWFIGYTPDLLCLVWVGFDDNRDLGLEGSRSALPVWTEFMKKAAKYREFRRPFGPPPEGMRQVVIDPESGQPAGPWCPTTRTVIYMAGREPKGTCPFHTSEADMNLAGSADRIVVPVSTP